MAREVHEREDLLRDAKALKPRVQLEIMTAEQTETVFAGFRRHGALSLYFDTEPVYHFNCLNRLRRAYVEDRIVKAEGGRLIALKRIQSDDSSVLLRHEMSDSEQIQFCRSLQKRLQELKEALSTKRYAVVGQVPEDGDVVSQLKGWLESGSDVAIADSPGLAN